MLPEYKWGCGVSQHRPTSSLPFVWTSVDRWKVALSKSPGNVGTVTRYDTKQTLGIFWTGIEGPTLCRHLQESWLFVHDDDTGSRLSKEEVRLNTLLLVSTENNSLMIYGPCVRQNKLGCWERDLHVPRESSGQQVHSPGLHIPRLRGKLGSGQTQVSGCRVVTTHKKTKSYFFFAVTDDGPDRTCTST